MLEVVVDRLDGLTSKAGREQTQTQQTNMYSAVNITVLAAEHV